MSRTSTRIALLALLVTVATTGTAGSVTSGGNPRFEIVNGDWRRLFAASPGGVPEINGRGTAFDPSRSEVISFNNELVAFQPVAPSPSSGRNFTARCPGQPAGYSVAFVSKHDEFVFLLLDSQLFKYGTFALHLGESVRWERLVPFGETPDLAYSAAIYDPVGDRVVVYGGARFDDSEDAVDEVWALSLGPRPHWTRLAPRGPQPPARMQHTAVYDPQRNAVLIYGGLTALHGSALSDAWSLDLDANPHWRRLATPGASPHARAGHAAAYDAARQRMVVIGGRSSSSYSPDAQLSDTWALGIGGPGWWRELQPSGEQPYGLTHPGWYTAFCAFADNARDRTVVIEGQGIAAYALDWNAGDAGDATTLTSTPEPDSPHAVHDELRLTVTAQPWRSGPLLARVWAPEPGDATIALYDAAGRRVGGTSRALVAGAQEVLLPVGPISPGVYFARLAQSGRTRAVKVVRLP